MTFLFLRIFSWHKGVRRVFVRMAVWLVRRYLLHHCHKLYVVHKKKNCRTNFCYINCKNLCQAAAVGYMKKWGQKYSNLNFMYSKDLYRFPSKGVVLKRCQLLENSQTWRIYDVSPGRHIKVQREVFFSIKIVSRFWQSG